MQYSGQDVYVPEKRTISGFSLVSMDWIIVFLDYLMNVVLHKTDNILTLVIHLTVYIAVRDAPASAKLQHLSGGDIHEHTSLLVVNPVVHTMCIFPACLTHFLATASRASFISMNVLASIQTNSINFTFCQIRKYGRENSLPKGCHQKSPDVIKCQVRIIGGLSKKKKEAADFYLKKH